MSALTFARANKSYKNINALNDFSLSIEKGEIFALAGINGAGKTTAIKSILGLCKIQSGSITLFDEEVKKSDIGFSPEIADLPEYLTVEETLAYAINFFEYSKKEKNDLVEEALSLFSLTDIRKKIVNELSKGNKQRVSLAAATVHNPKLIILDEPASGLDPIGRNLVKQAIKKLKEKGKTILFTTHILSDIPDICDKFAIIHNGTIIFNGKPKNFCEDPYKFEQTFLEYISNYKQAQLEETPEIKRNVCFKSISALNKFTQTFNIAKYIFLSSIRNKLILGSLLLILPIIYASWLIEINNPGFQTGFLADMGSFFIESFIAILALILVFSKFNENNKSTNYFILSRINNNLYPSGIFIGIILSILPAVVILILALYAFTGFSGKALSYLCITGITSFCKIALSVSVFMLLNTKFKKIISFGLLIIYFVFFNIGQISNSISNYHFILQFPIQILITFLPDYSIFNARYESFDLIWLILYTLSQSSIYLYISGLIFDKKDF